MTVWLMPPTDIDFVESILARPIEAEKRGEISALGPEPLRVLPGGTAVIKVKGVLMDARSEALDYWGITHTAYPDIAAQTQEAKRKGARRIRYDISSPGGMVSGILPAMDAIREAGIPTRAIGENKLTSGAYMLASQADKIEATDELTTVGSIGVAADYVNDPVVKSLSNTASPGKRPDLNSEEGLDMKRAELDDVFTVLSERMASGRRVSTADIEKNYGRGAVMTARTALAKGMIDGIWKPAPLTKSREGKEKAMNLEELKTEHPALYQSVFAEGEKRGFAAGELAERERVLGHLELADGSEDMASAREDISSGAAITPKVMARHQSAFMKRSMQASREADNPGSVAVPGQAPVAASIDEDVMAKAKFEAAHPGWEVS